VMPQRFSLQCFSRQSLLPPTSSVEFALLFFFLLNIFTSLTIHPFFLVIILPIRILIAKQ
jgi:hypothetical protein